MHFLIMSALGAFLLIKAVILLLKGRRSHGWNPVIGQVKDARHIVEEGSLDRTQRMSHALIHYQYRVDGKSYTSDRVRFKWTHHRISDELEKYQPGNDVTVYVNPEDPWDSVLEKGTDLTNYMAMLCGGVFVIAGIALALTV